MYFVLFKYVQQMRLIIFTAVISFLLYFCNRNKGLDINSICMVKKEREVISPEMPPYCNPALHGSLSTGIP